MYIFNCGLTFVGNRELLQCFRREIHAYSLDLDVDVIQIHLWLDLLVADVGWAEASDLTVPFV